MRFHHNAKAWAVGLAFLASCASATPQPEAGALPGNSIYQWKGSLSDQDGRGFQLSEKRGKPVLISMFYNSCEFVCPMLIDTIRMTEERLTAKQRNGLQIVLVTFDPERDDTGVLKSVFKKRDLTAGQWTLARSSAGDVRKLAALLSIQYRRLANGEYNHSTALILLDAEGRIVARSNQLGTVDAQFLASVEKAIGS